MSLLYGFSKDECVESSGNIKTHNVVMIFTKYGVNEVIKTFNTGVMLIGITTTAASSYNERVYYYVCESNGLTIKTKIRPHDEKKFYFDIHTEDELFNMDGLKIPYTVPRPCSITMKLRGEKSKGAAPLSNPIELSITLCYVEVSTDVNFKDSNIITAF